MNLNTIIKQIQRKLNDFSILRTDIVDEINEVQLFVASFSRLPALLVQKYNFPVSANTGDEKMPNNYHHNLYSVYSETTHKRITIYSNTLTLYSGYNETETGTLDMVCEENNRLYMRPKLSQDEDLLISYYKIPTDLEDDADDPETPSILPEEFHKQIFVSGPVSNLSKNPETRGASLQDYQNGIQLIKWKYPLTPKLRTNYRRKIKDF